MEARELISGVLAISDEIARLTSLTREIMPRERRASSIVIPSSERLRRLKRAVTFRRTYLANLLIAHGVLQRNSSVTSPGSLRMVLKPASGDIIREARGKLVV